jgi:hypothetical protein
MAMAMTSIVQVQVHVQYPVGSMHCKAIQVCKSRSRPWLACKAGASALWMAGLICGTCPSIGWGARKGQH